MKKDIILIIGFVVLLVILIFPKVNVTAVDETALDELLARINALEQRIAYLESFHPSIDACVENWTCTEWSECSVDNVMNRICIDENICETVNNKPAETQACVYDLCKDVVCDPVATVCGDGFVANCENTCSEGVCSTCVPDCTGHDAPLDKNIVIFQMDDTQCWWLEDISEEIINMHVEKNIPLVAAAIPFGLEDQGCLLRQKLPLWNSYEQIEIADHGYDHGSSDSWIGCYGVEGDKERIARGLELFQEIGITPTSYSPTGGDGWSRCGWNGDTLTALDELGFNTFFGGGLLDDWWNKVEIPELLSLTNGVYLCQIDGEQNCNSFKTYNNLVSRIDQQIDERGVAVVIFHQQDFQTSINKNTYSNYLDNLKNSGDYVFMTAEQYHEYINT